MNNKTLFKFPLINIWTIIITLIFMLAQYMNIINWNAIWIFSPLWIPLITCIIIVIFLYCLKLLAYILLGIIKLFEFIKRKLKNKYHL